MDDLNSVEIDRLLDVSLAHSVVVDVQEVMRRLETSERSRFITATA